MSYKLKINEWSECVPYPDQESVVADSDQEAIRKARESLVQRKTQSGRKITAILNEGERTIAHFSFQA